MSVPEQTPKSIHQRDIILPLSSFLRTHFCALLCVTMSSQLRPMPATRQSPVELSRYTLLRSLFTISRMATLEISRRLGTSYLTSAIGFLVL